MTTPKSQDEIRTENAVGAEFPHMAALPTTLDPDALIRVGLPDDGSLHAEVQELLKTIEPGHGNAMLRLSLTDDILGARLVAAQRTTTGWGITEAAAVTYSRRDEKLTARVELGVSW